MFTSVEEISFEPPIRIFSLNGGVSCMSGSNGLCWLLLPRNRTTFWTALNKTAVPFPLNDLGPLRILTQNYFSHAEKLDDPLPDACWLNATSENGAPIDQLQFERWSGISVALRNRGAFAPSIRAQRISHQIRLCVHQLEWLIKAYRSTLIEKFCDMKISRPESGTYSFTSDKFAANIGYHTQSFLNELFALRDFIFSFLFEELYGEVHYEWKKLAKRLQSDDRFALAHIILPVILPATSREKPVGQIALMSIYRNAIFHYLGPNSGPLGPIYTIQERDTLLGTLPILKYPLYDNLDYLMSVEKGGHLNISGDHKEEAIRFMQSPLQIDALDLCYDTFVLLLRIAHLIELKVGIPSEIQTITDKDIIQAELRDGDGTVRRVRRNDLGELEQY